MIKTILLPEGGMNKSKQDDQTNALKAQANTSISAKTNVLTESRLPELKPNEQLLIKNRSDIDTLILHLQQKFEMPKERLEE
jgi:hypothetical protein